MILPILKYPDPRLARICEPVTEITPELRELVKDMIETMYAREGVGLAAPQVGQAIQLVVIDVSGPDQPSNPQVFVNPKLTLTGTKIESDEGCLSVLDFNAPVVRSSEVQLEAQDLDGKAINFTADGLLAICLQHECDHLEGKLFIDRISRLKRGMYDRKLSKKKK